MEPNESVPKQVKKALQLNQNGSQLAIVSIKTRIIEVFFIFYVQGYKSGETTGENPAR